MAWEGSDRHDRLPADWDQLRLDVFARDGYRCTFTYPNGGRCPETTELECDHVKRGDDHSKGNLTTLCHRHHEMKSAREGAHARWDAIADKKRKFRRTEAHPGLIPRSAGAPRLLSRGPAQPLP